MNWLKILFPYRTHLENELTQQRDDFTVRLAEKDTEIRRLRVELAARKVGPAPTGTFEGSASDERKKTIVEAAATAAPEDWHADLTKMLKEEEDGIRHRGRVQEHESRADDGA